MSTIKKVVLSFMFLAISSLGFAQNTVKGTVVDSDGLPLSGTYVIVKGTQRSTPTDLDGHYSIQAGEKDILLFSFLGMADQEVLVGKRSVIDVTMQKDTQTLDDVVVVAYGQQKKTSLTGSVSSVSGKELLQAPATNITSLLGGRVAGIASVQESGQPGADQASLTIRGSRYGVTYIVDGMPRSIDDIDPSDIASISVLKDASAAAIYGMKSAGGVIIVTTKKGREGANNINYTGNFGVSQNANFPDFLNAEQFAWYYNKACEMDGYDPVFTQEQVQLMMNGDDSDGWGNTNWIDKVFGLGFTQKHNISAQGGNDKFRYYAALGYMDQNGNIKSYQYDRFNLRSNLEAQIANSLKLVFGVSGQIGKTRSPGFSSGGSESDGTWMSVARQTIAAHPYLPAEYDGLPVATPNKIGQGSSPLAAIDKSGYNNSDGYQLQTNVELEWQVPFVKGLYLKAAGSYDHSYSTSKILATPYYVNLATVPDDGSTTMKYSKVLDVRGNSYNTLGEGLYRSIQLVGNGSIGYINTFDDKHNLDIMLMTEIRNNKYNGFASYGKELPFIELPELSLSTPADSPISGWSSISRTLGFIGRLRYDFSNKYFFEFTGRYDGSYKFAGNVEGKRWGFFPAGSVGWRISEESFMYNAKGVDNLKLRVSAGELGSDNVSEYAFLNQYYASSPLYLNGGRYNSLYIGGVANRNLTWERIRSYNVGVDLEMWNGMLGASVDGFYNYNYDILMYMGSNYPASMGGYYPSIENYGSLDSRGLEITLSHKNIVNPYSKHPFTYNISLNLTYAESRWIKYPDSANVPDYQCLTGKEYGIMLGWVADGLYQTEEEIDNSPWPMGQRPRVGDIKYVDLNGDGVVYYEDKAFVGRTNRPKLNAGLNFNMSWMGFDFSCLITGAALFDISLTGTYYNGMDDNTIFTETFKEGGNSPLYLVEQAWRPDNTSGTYPRLTMNSPTNNNGLASTFWFRDGKYIKLKSAQLGYSLPRDIIRHAGMDNLRFFIEGSNLFTLSGLPKGIDPESPGVNNGYYPQQRLFMGGVSITF